MNKLIAYLKLVRLPNLLIIIFTQYIVRFGIIEPILKKESLSLQMSDLLFALFVLSTVLIAAAAYVINDYFDIRIDHINKPNKIILGKLISRRKAILLHYIFNGIAIIFGFYVAYRVGSLKIGLFFPMISVLMWYYSIKYKKMLLLGNVVIAFLSAFVIIVVWLFEFFALKSNGFVVIHGIQELKYYLFGFAGFAFIFSLAREIIKDIEDVDRDGRTGCKTLPVLAGIGPSKYTVIGIISISIIFLALLFKYFSENIYLKSYLILIILISIALIVYLFFCKTKKQFSMGSILLKILMILGALSPLFIYILKQ